MILHQIYEIHFVFICLFGFYVAFNTVQVISRRVVGRAEETSTYSSLGFDSSPIYFKCFIFCPVLVIVIVSKSYICTVHK